MARIVYAVAGEGFGHSSRSQLIGQMLIEAGHDVIFAGSNKSLIYRREHFGERVKEVFGLLFYYRDGRINPAKTILKNFWEYRRGYGINHKLYKECFDKFKPELVITDFEPFSAWWALRNRVPFFSIDHQHLLTHCRLHHPPGNLMSRLNAYVVTRGYYGWANSYIILNFFKAPAKTFKAVTAPPVIRPQVAGIKSEPGETIVIYVTHSMNEEKIRQVLTSFSSQKFIVYGYNKNENAGNITFRERSTEGFLKDAASSKGVAASAGFSLISECMHFRKKMLLLPIKGQYEQIINAHYIEQFGLGLSRNEITEQSLSEFIAEMEKPMPQDERILWPSNEKFFDVLQQRLNQLSEPIKI
ncbi:MAG: glycosyltransferase family protein [Phycisphaerae bacterium]|jgi:uncharacterized protein (TIGR00661 family)